MVGWEDLPPRRLGSASCSSDITGSSADSPHGGFAAPCALLALSRVHCSPPRAHCSPCPRAHCSLYPRVHFSPPPQCSHRSPRAATTRAAAPYSHRGRAHTHGAFARVAHAQVVSGVIFVRVGCGGWWCGGWWRGVVCGRGAWVPGQRWHPVWVGWTVAMSVWGSVHRMSSVVPRP